MKLSLCFAIISTLSATLLAAVPTLGQNINETRIPFQVRQEPLKSALRKLQTQSGFNILFPSSIINNFTNVTVITQNNTVADVLDILLSGTGLTYAQDGKTIIISKNDINGKKIGNALAKQVIGMVIDEDGVPLPGVTVRIKNNRVTSTATDVNGHFNIAVNSEDDILIFNYVGYTTQEVRIGDESNLKIILKAAVGSLNEVQVIGYGTSTRRLNTGAVSSLNAEDITKQTVANPIQALAGRIAGMTVVQSNGLPGSNSTVQIRGNNTLGNLGLSGSLPLFIVDGVPFTNFNGGLPFTDNLNSFGIVGANGGISPFSVINPQDIERIDVLKDADATAIYGARGGNGVILITTKKGRSGKTQVNANVYTGLGKVSKHIDMLNTEQYLELRKEAFKNDGVTPTTVNAPDLLTWDPNAYTDWQKLLLGGTAHVTDAQISYSGGNERVKFFTSGNYRKEGTVYPGDMGNDRISGRINLSTNSQNNRFTTLFSVNYANDNTNLITTDVANALSLPPNYPLYNADGSLYWGAGFTNPYANLLKTTKSTTSNFIANGDLRYALLRGLSIKTNLGYTRTNLVQSSQNPLSSQNPSSTGISNSARFANTVSSNYIIEPQVEYSRQFGKNSFSALAGSTFQQNVSDATSIAGSNYAYEAALSTINGAGTVSSTNNYQIYKYASVFSRLNYNFDKKYIINGTFRRDASSRFGPRNQFANFGAVGAAWVFSEESFVKNKLSFLSFGKLRGSYGSTGNDQLPNYSYLSLFTVGSSANAYQNVATLALSNLPNPDLKWESTKKLEFGIDLGFFNDRLLFKADAYWHRSSSQLTYASPSLVSGFNSINTNLGAVIQNKGLEFELNSTNISTANFKWNTAFNISFQTNKLLSFTDQASAFYATSFAVGYPVALTRLYPYQGINPENGAVIIQDLDGIAGTNSATDRYNASVGTPYFCGMNNTFSYKNFSLDVFLQFNHRMGTINSVNGTRPGSLNNQNISVLSRWRNPGDTNVLFPGASANPGGNIYASYTYFGSSDFFYGDASFLKLRSANLSYTLPSRISGLAKLTNARVYVQGQNLLTWSKNKYVLDPESGNSVPPLRTIVVGLSLTF